MTNQEFSNEFDILYNNIASNQAPGLDEYEKSVFLTDAQDALVLEMITGKNLTGDSFEKTEEIRQYLTDIIKTAELEKYVGNNIQKISDKSTLYNTPEDLWVTTYESVSFGNNTCKSEHIAVLPVTQDEFSRIIKNPFKKASNNRVLRLNIAGKIELVSEYNIDKYTIRYIKKLNPIILSDLPTGLSIKGKTNETKCELNPALHEAILGRAVQLAKASMGLIESGR